MTEKDIEIRAHAYDKIAKTVNGISKRWNDDDDLQESLVKKIGNRGQYSNDLLHPFMNVINIPIEDTDFEQVNSELEDALTQINAKSSAMSQQSVAKLNLEWNNLDEFKTLVRKLAEVDFISNEEKNNFVNAEYYSVETNSIPNIGKFLKLSC